MENAISFPPFNQRERDYVGKVRGKL